MKSKKKYALLITLFLLLIIGTYYFVLKDYSLKEFETSLQNCKIFYIVISFICVFLFAFFGALFLKRMLKHFNKKVTWFHSFGYVMTEVYFSAITPSSTGGQPVQMYEMNKDGIMVRTSGIVVLLNTILYKIALILIALILVPIYLKSIFNINTVFNYLIVLGTITNILVIILFIAMIYSKKTLPKIIKGLISFGNKIHIIKNKETLIKKFEDALKDYKKCASITKQKPLILLEGLIYMILQRLSILSISYFIYLSFGLNKLSCLELIAFQVCITLASDFVPLPGGVGISESLLLKINKFIYGATLATSSMILLRGISFYIFVILGGIFYLIFHLSKRKKTKKIAWKSGFFNVLLMYKILRSDKNETNKRLRGGGQSIDS